MLTHEFSLDKALPLQKGPAMPLMDVGNTLIWQCLKLCLPSGTTLKSVRRSASDQPALIVERAKLKGYKFKRPPTVGDESSWLESLEACQYPK